MPTREQVADYLRRLPAITIRVLCFSVPALMIALGIVVPILLGLAMVAIWAVNQPGSIFDTEFIGDLWPLAAGAIGLGALAYVTFWIVGSSRRLQAGLAAVPGMLIGLLLVFALLVVAILVQGWLPGEDRIPPRWEVTVSIIVIGLVASAVLIWPIVWSLRKFGGVEVVHPRMSVFAWALIAWLLLVNVEEKPETPEAAATKAANKAEARYRRSPQPPDADKLAREYQPKLLFDRGERDFPLDVEEFFAERGKDGDPSHEVCSDTALGYECSDVAQADDLEPRSGDHRAVIALDTNPADDPKTRGRIYYHVDADDPDGRVHIDYWIFYRYNDSPKFSKHTCLSGLSIKDLTCFDHEGDWEGITVSLTRDRKPQSVAYAGHHWRHRFAWEDLERLDVIEDGHPKVWVARGSHASYPGPCGNRVRRGGRLVRVSCDQPETDVPDGDRSPSGEWRCGPDCVKPLPLKSDGRPTRWAAFSGFWGAPRCTVGTRLCTRSLGPDTPPFQGRYADPGGKGIERRFLRELYGDAARRLPPLGGA